MLKLAVSILLIAFGSAHAEPGSTQSYEPSPSGRIEIQHDQPKPQNAQSATDYDKRGTQEVPIFVKVVPSPTTEADAAEQKEERSQSATNERGLVVATWILAVVTGALAIVAAFQAALFVWQLGYMRQGVIDAGKAANAALISAESLKKSEMAHIIVTKIEFKKSSGPTHRADFRVFFGNFGRTPGFIHTTRLWYAPLTGRNEPSVIDAVKETARGGSQNSGFILAPSPTNEPRAASDVYGTDILSADEITWLEDAKGQLFVWGEVEFSPVFGETVFGERWISQFAYRVNLAPGKNLKNVSVGGAEYWRYYQKS